MDIHSVYRMFMPLFRRRRMTLFMDIFQPGPETRILDIGGLIYNWTLVGCKSQITLLNIYTPKETSTLPPNFSFVQGDGTSLAYPDNSFDIAYSNSVIEHLHSYDNQVRFAKEVMRVSRKVWVQTPARFFPIEPHLLTPFIHYLPRSWQRHLLKNFTVWGLVTRATQGEVDAFLDEVRLLTFSEMKSLFPGCRIYRERFLLLTKSYIAVRTDS